MSTAFLLLAQYNGAAIIPLSDVCRDYFSHLSPEQFWRKHNDGAITMPVVVLDPTSNKSAKGVALQDLAQWIDERTAAARTECQQMTGKSYG